MSTAATLMLLSLAPIALGQGEQAAGFVWTDQFGTAWGDTLWAVDADASGVFAAGGTRGALPNQTSVGGEDAFVRKYDLDGSEVWTRQFGSPATDDPVGIVIDSDGVYVAGETQGALPGQSHVGGTDAFVRKYDLDGNEVWTRQFGTASEDILYDVDIDASGIYVSGMTGDSLGNQTNLGSADAFVRKYDADGNEVWTRQFGSPGDEWGFGVGVGPSGVYVGGEIRAPNETGMWHSHAFIWKFDAEGNEQWSRWFDIPGGWNRARGVAVDASGAYVVGEMTGPNETGVWHNHAFTRKYDPEGNLLWGHEVDTGAYDYSNNVAVDPHGVYVVGSTTESLARSNPENDKDVFLLKYDASGRLLWTFQFGSWAAEDGALGLAASPFGVYVAGGTFGYLLGGRRAGDEADAFLARIGETPVAPGNLRATAGDGRVVVAWDPPDWDGDLPITGYRVYRSALGAAAEPIAVVGSGDREHIDRDVVNNVTYRYRVAAINEVGEGPWSATVRATPRPLPLLILMTPEEFVTYDSHVVLEGRSDPDATVMVDGAAVPVASDGVFRWSATLPDGRHEVEVVAENAIGLTSTATVTVIVDTRTPLLILVGVMSATAVGAILLYFVPRRWGPHPGEQTSRPR